MPMPSADLRGSAKPRKFLLVAALSTVVLIDFSCATAKQQEHKEQAAALPTPAPKAEPDAATQAQEQERMRKAAAQEKLAYAKRFEDLERHETGAFWNCVMSSEVDIGMFSRAEQFQMRIESAYFTQQHTFADHLVVECIPMLERARQACADLPPPPAELAEPLRKYREALPKLLAGLEAYAEKIRKRKIKDTDQLIQDLGTVWHTTLDITAETVAYEKFLYCAIPGLAKMKDAEEVLGYMVDQCFKKDAVAFMDRVRKDCGGLLVVPDKGAKVSARSVPHWRKSHEKFLEEEMRQLQAWDSCCKRSRKGKKTEDIGQFLEAVNEYMAARIGVAVAVRGLYQAAK
jgi:hypothetical protein